LAFDFSFTAAALATPRPGGHVCCCRAGFKNRPQTGILRGLDSTGLIPLEIVSPGRRSGQRRLFTVIF
jgi:hypothetical protein